MACPGIQDSVGKGRGRGTGKLLAERKREQRTCCPSALNDEDQSGYQKEGRKEAESHRCYKCKDEGSGPEGKAALRAPGCLKVSTEEMTSSGGWEKWGEQACVVVS